MSPQTMGKLAKLHEGVRSCVKCPLYQSRTHAVPGEGDPQAAIMVVGEAPGRMEDREGRPFVGPSGRFLITLLEQNGLSREAVFITNSVKCRPPNNRFPHVKELEICKQHWLLRQIELVDPKVIVLLGRAPLRQLLGEQATITQSHGQFFRKDGRLYLIQYHPSAGLRSPAVRTTLQQDFQRLKQAVTS
jgi:uracil-DNA glycosylase family 4